jgi:hypothetical protein
MTNPIATEKNYEFRLRMDTVHKRGMRNHGLKPAGNEACLKDGWSIGVIEGCSEVILHAAKDLQDYLLASMGISTPLLRKTAESIATEKQCVILCEKKELPRFGKGLKAARSYRVTTRGDQVVVCGFDERGAAQGSYYLEDLMNLRESPFLVVGELIREPLFSPRMTHSGWGLDQFPDSHLNAIAHAGMDAILLMVKGVDITTRGYLDFNDLVRRAKLHGLDVYFYSYLKCWKHPDDEDAEKVYDNVFGSLFRACPGAKGIVLVGESCEFPSRDERTTMRPWTESVVDGIPADKPSPGWWPCRDYACWVNMVKTVVQKWSPKADIVFWTYNWGYAPEKERIELINSLPNDISLQVTFEMFDQIRNEDVVNPVMDYTISYPGPGKYFVSEAKAASKKGIRLYSMTNTGGCTWDFGVTPYEPFPFQWAKRHEAMLDARGKWGLSGLMESHQYGFYPSFVSDFTKWNFWSASPSADEILRRIAVRDFGVRGATHALKAWALWSEAIAHYIPTSEDQYGPNRVGPSYPLIFHPDITRTFTSKELAMNSPQFAHHGGSTIVKTFYHPYENAQQSPAPQRIDVEIRSYRKAKSLFEKGIVEIRKAIQAAPETKRKECEKQELLAQFMSNTVSTTIHVKEWWKLNQRLFVESDRKKAHAVLDALVKVAQAEIENAEATIPVVERDSRLGWEPTMEYMCDRPHLEWKIRQVRHVIGNEISLYRKMIDL